MSIGQTFSMGVPFQCGCLICLLSALQNMDARLIESSMIYAMGQREQMYKV